MDGYKIKKVLNNNVVIAQKNSEELILIGKGIGFDFGKNGTIPEQSVENVFAKQTSEMGENYQKVLQSIDSKIVGIAEEIINYAEAELKVKLNDAIHISLPDHISFALKRIEKGVNIENPFINELSALYPGEYRISVKAVELINERFNTDLPEDEAGFICLHIRAALTEKNVSESLAYTKKISQVMDLIEKLTGKKLEKNSLAYIRTVTHINFMIERVENNKTIKNHLLESIKKELFTEYSIGIKIAMKIEDLFSMDVPEDEIGYIALHIKRLVE
ncbi:PRD domain-containing protein [Clostridium magnum]|uniref:PtsGHI operon antiterminator n=1 Tax=Clostridium magnum DSM 2767 TaxID=1121326 RepID=A0A161Y6S3_9CLOT|nr:PRD domain-containing protein [Clostridium magnum]KZL94039.1 PtsGHI operon antiterminator [Clostridium magnum DSM 2767]SHI00864.1 transcriptional antiterminator, BglG family [Clostridium magnum DSM 2767]